MQPDEALQTMEKANKIIEDFSTAKYVLFAVIFTIETVLCFWLALSLV